MFVWAGCQSMLTLSPASAGKHCSGIKRKWGTMMRVRATGGKEPGNEVAVRTRLGLSRFHGLLCNTADPDQAPTIVPQYERRRACAVSCLLCRKRWPHS